MSEIRPSPVAFSPIERHGVIGDRRTGALVSADGTLNWFCTPNFDGAPIFGALLDPNCGGFCHFGPRGAREGRQRYDGNTATLITAWTDNQSLELSDVMAWPDDERPEEFRDQRAIIRHMKATTEDLVRFDLFPRNEFWEGPKSIEAKEGGASFAFKQGSFGIWASFPLIIAEHGVSADLELKAGGEHWVVLGWNVQPGNWSVPRAIEVSREAASYWDNWSSQLKINDAGSRDAALRRSGFAVQLLTHAERNSAVAALTTSLPERLGGDRNYDYRYAWVRDASLSLDLFSCLGKVGEVKRYLNWLCGLKSETAAPLQVCYRLDGNTKLKQEKIPDVLGYENSRPVLRGNRAAKQKQLGATGFLADCTRTYLDHDGEWRDEFWQLLKRCADHTAKNWQGKDAGIWELPEEAHHVTSRVMCWVALDRAIHIAGKTGHPGKTDHWREAANAIHAEVMAKGWCEEKNSFRQQYDSDALDASALIIPLLDFLPIDHPRVVGTIAAIEKELVVKGLVHRFDPTASLGGKQLPIGEFEGAFLPCVFWHVQVLAKAGRCDEAEAILSRCEAVAGEIGLFAEEIDAHHDRFLGNTPLLFSQVEYAFAVKELSKARARAKETTGAES
jgi:GH15 family glucan-1,4-alpha-glucosidase